jgi:hypothetical protein
MFSKNLLFLSTIVCHVCIGNSEVDCRKG